MAELVVMSNGELEAALLRQCDECFGLVGIDRERLLHVHVAAMLQASLGDLKMAWRRSGDVDNIGPGFIEKCLEAGEGVSDGKPFAELARHQRLAITGANDLASLDPLYLGCMRVGDLSAANESDLKHFVLPPGSSQNNALTPRPSALLASSRVVSSTCRCCSGSFSTLHASVRD